MTIKKPKVREVWEAVKALVFGPYTLPFPKKPSVPFPRFRGKPEYHEKDCVGCTACMQVCPANTIEVEDKQISKDRGVRKLTLHLDVCQYCGLCELNCITEKGIQLSNEYDLATFDRKSSVVEVEKETVYCGECGELIAPIDHLKWLASRLGIMAFSNQNLFLAKHLDLGLIKERMKRPKDKPLHRGDHLRLLCPKCRREILIKEEWGY